MNASRNQLQWQEGERWFVKADEDLEAARVLLKADTSLAFSAAYHCQQAAEKMIKGLLAVAAERLQRTHDLDALAESAANRFPDLTAHLDFCRPLTSWGTMYRYPMIEMDVALAPTVGEIEEVLNRLTDFRKDIAVRGSVETN